MGDKRRTERLGVGSDNKAVLSCRGVKEEASIIDVSTGGMKVVLAHPVDSGAEVTGEFRVLPFMGPFFVKGKVNRVAEIDGQWELGISFDKVSTCPLA